MVIIDFIKNLVGVYYGVFVKNFLINEIIGVITIDIFQKHNDVNLLKDDEIGKLVMRTTLEGGQMNDGNNLVVGVDYSVVLYRYEVQQVDYRIGVKKSNVLIILKAIKIVIGNVYLV